MRITEKKTVKIENGCKANPVFVSWKNTLGGTEHWLFFKRQTLTLSTERREDFEAYDEDLENSRGQVLDVAMFAQPKIICFAHVAREDVEALMSITYSPSVEVLTNPDTWQTDGAKWSTYRPEAGSFTVVSTNETHADVEITFLKNYINNVRR